MSWCSTSSGFPLPARRRWSWRPATATAVSDQTTPVVVIGHPRCRLRQNYGAARGGCQGRTEPGARWRTPTSSFDRAQDERDHGSTLTAPDPLILSLSKEEVGGDT